MNRPQLRLRPGREKSLQRRHPWIFSGGIQTTAGEPANGDVVDVVTSKGDFLAVAHYQETGSITGRILSWENKDIDQNFYAGRIKEAFQYRLNAGVAGLEHTTVFRLVFGEGDLLPGLIIDKYGDTAVIQCHTAGMYQHRNLISNALTSIPEIGIIRVYNKSKEVPGIPDSSTGYLAGDTVNDPEVLEHGYRFIADWEEGQKTGFFIDQRENRALLGKHSKGKRVLNTFSYTGGFSIYALGGGADKCVSVDVSERAIHLANRNAQLNGFEQRHTGVTADVFQYLANIHPGEFDVIVLDPPAFAKSHRVSHNAIQGYKRLNVAAIKKLKPGGILFTFSCSQVIDAATFYNTIMSAAIECGRNIRVMQQLSQPADHPINIFHPEGIYLKGLVLEIG